MAPLIRTEAPHPHATAGRRCQRSKAARTAKPHPHAHVTACRCRAVTAPDRQP
ncbi:hypothetical protein [Glycomyces sp. NPDC021274]|uniref:hypothetical protein n=1 Tax=Glycomyces sp. NPDC021274 TaxID=3155120 RepID=UPI0033CCDCAC